MRWWVFLIMGIVAVGLDSGLASVFTLRGLGWATPSFAACLLAFIALQARPRTVFWAAWVLGLMMDLSPTAAAGSAGIPVIGPQTLAAVAAVQVVLLLRPVVFRRRVITIAVMAGIVMVCLGLGAAALETVRWWLPWTHALAPPPTGQRVLTVTASAGYTVLVGIPISAFLVLTGSWWRFDAPPGRLDYAGSRW